MHASLSKSVAVPDPLQTLVETFLSWIVFIGPLSEKLLMLPQVGLLNPTRLPRQMYSYVCQIVIARLRPAVFVSATALIHDVRLSLRALPARPTVSSLQICF